MPLCTDGSPTVCKRDTGLVCSLRVPSQRGRRKRSSARETQDSSSAQGLAAVRTKKAIVCKRHKLGRNCVCVKPFLCYNCYNREILFAETPALGGTRAVRIVSESRSRTILHIVVVRRKVPPGPENPLLPSGTEARGKGPVQPVCLRRTVGKPPVLSVRSLHT